MTLKFPTCAQAFLMLLTAFVLVSSDVLAQSQDYTQYVLGADCDDISYWSVVGVSPTQGNNGVEYSVPATDGGAARLVCDTWSSRGGKDGSQMTTPFMEYHKGATAGQVSYLPDAQLRHQTITGLPKGKYKIGMRVRVYCEQYYGLATPRGVKLYANGAESADLLVGKTPTSYGTGVYVAGIQQIECSVGDDGKLDFGLNVSGAGATEVNWLAWKDVTLTYLGDGSLQAGDYYLRNKATGLYLEAGGKWGTQAVAGSHGIVLTAEKQSSGLFSLASDFYNGNIHWLMTTVDDAGENPQCYVDGSQEIWQIQPAADGTGFTLYSPTREGYLMMDEYDFIHATGTDATDASCVWEFVTANNRIKGLLDGTETDATFFISDPRFDRGIKSSDWEGTFSTGGVNNYTGYGNQVAEVWGGNASTIDVRQTLMNLPNGRYQLSVQGFFRYNDQSDNSNDRALETHQEGTEKLYSFLFAQSGDTEQSQPLQSIAGEDELLSDYGMPTNMETAGRYFSWGYYSDNQLTIDVTNHKLTIGITKEEQDGCDWTVWDNFTLTLLQLGDNSDYKYEEEEQEGDIDFASATLDNPVDCTSLIQNPGFNSTSGWSGSPSRSNGLVTYGGTNVAKTTFDVNQTLTDIPNGWYRLRVQGFYRYGDTKTEEHYGYGGNNENQYNNVWATYTIPYATISRRIGQERLLATLYANSSQVGLQSIFEGAHDSQTHTGDISTEFGWVPNTTAGVAEAFADGEYWNELMVYVTNGYLNFGVSKPRLGYKYDWTCFDNFQLEYLGTEGYVDVTSVQIGTNSLNLSLYEQKPINIQVLPANATNQRIQLYSGDTSIATIGPNNTLVAVGPGTTTLGILAYGGLEQNYWSFPVTVTDNSGGNASDLVINEIQVSNLDQYLDPTGNYGGWIELYNPTDRAVRLTDFYLTDDLSNPYKSRISGECRVPAHGFQTLFFDHNAGESGNTGGTANFKPDMDGGTIALCQGGSVIASVTYPAAVSRTSWARILDGEDIWAMTAYPTPAASNSGSQEFVSEDTPRVPTPTATPSGFYTMQGFRPDIQGEGTIYCTLDGSVPTEQNGILPTDLPALNGTTVLRMRAFQEGYLPSPVATYTYSAEQHHHTLPVLLVTADPAQVYSDSLGIFVTGNAGVTGAGLDYPCNWNMDWDRSAHMELLDKDGQRLFRQDVNLSRFGGWSRSWFPYNFKLKAQKQYEGKNYLEYPFFTDTKPYLKHKVLQVRNGGNDVSCRIKDAAIQQMVIRSGFYLDCLDWQPVHCYINGRYCGLQNLRQPSNKHFAVGEYGLDSDEEDALEVTWGVTVKAGSSSAFNQWRSLTYSASDDDIYRQICDLVDVQEFANYMAAELYLGGDDWPGNNCKAFKGNDGKFHIVFFDVDQSLRFDRNAFSRLNSNQTPLIVMFQNMLQNDTFRKLFIDSYCLFGGSVMQVERCHAIVDEMSAVMNPALALEGLSTSPTAEYIKQTLNESRRQTMMDALRSWSHSQLSSGTRAYQVKLTASIPDARLQVNGLDVPLANFNGTLFAPAVLTAEAPEGYTFQGWRTGSIYISRNRTLDLAALSADQAATSTLSIEAYFTPVATDEDRISELAMPIKVNEVSAGNTVFASETWERGDWVELYNTTDTDLDAEGLYLSDDLDQPMKWQVKKTSEVCNTLIPARGHLIVWADGIGSQSGLNQLHTTFKLANSDNQTVIAVSGDEFVDRNAHFFNDHPDMKAFIDGLSYNAHRGDETTGRYPDGGSTFYRLTKPTPERTNIRLAADQTTGTDRSLMELLPDGIAIDLAEGWNWTSHPLHTAFAPADLSAYAERIVGQKREATRSGTRMVGNLNYLDAGHLFKVKMTQADTYSSDRQLCASDLPISLVAGWNWVGYPVDGAQALTAALASYLPTEGDKIMGQDGFATYTDGQWTGTLTTLETGKGYMMQTSQAKSFSFHAPQTALHFSRARRAQAQASVRYGFSKHAYPNVMGIIGTLEQEDTPAGVPALDGFPVENYTLLAYSGDECRGAAQWVDGHLFLTAYGQGGEPLQFFALREDDGTLLPVEAETTTPASTPAGSGSPAATSVLAFTPDVLGTLQAPVRFTLADDSATGLTDLATGTSPRLTVEGYYSLSGQRLGGLGTQLSRGIYILKYADGSFRKVQVK